MAALLPVALLAALIGVQTFGDGQSLVIDARLGGVLVAGFAVWRRWPFLVVVALAAATHGPAAVVAADLVIGRVLAVSRSAAAGPAPGCRR